MNEARDIEVGGTLVRGLRELEGEATLLGHVDLFGHSANVFFLRVCEGECGQAPVSDSHDRWAALTEAEPEGVFCTVEVPGHEGEWVYFVSPQME